MCKLLYFHLYTNPGRKAATNSMQAIPSSGTLSSHTRKEATLSQEWLPSMKNKAESKIFAQKDTCITKTNNNTVFLQSLKTCSYSEKNNNLVKFCVTAPSDDSCHNSAIVCLVKIFGVS